MMQQIRYGLMASFIAFAPLIRAQQFTNNGAGHWYTNAGVNGVTIGTNIANAPAALTVRGGDMFTPNTELFRTITPTGQNGFWSAYRNNIRIGEVYTTNPGLGFHIRAVMDNGGGIQQPGILWLENDDQDGLVIRSNDLTGLYTPTVNTYPLACQGFASLGVRTDGTDGTLTMPSRARLHMVDVDGAVEEPWRPYDRNGTLFTGNHDMAYVGHRYYHGAEDDPWEYETDHSDLLINAGEDDMEDALRQRIRFTYTTRPDPSATTGAATYDGLEFMQLWPDTATEGFVGIGDFHAALVNPSERLDILNRTIRLRDFGTPALYHNDSYDRVLVVNPVDGLVHWRDANTIGSGSGSGCNWNYVSSANRMYTAFDPVGAGSCPQKDWLVGIGESVPKTKLDVYAVRSLDNSTGAIHGLMKANTSGAVQSGLVASVEPETSGNTVTFGIGSDASATDINKGYGARGTVNLVTSGLSTSDAFGTYGYVNAAGGTANNVVGARGEVQITGGTIDRYVAGTYGLVNGPSTGSAAISYGMYGLSYGRGTITGNSYGGYGQAYSYSGSVTDSYGLYGISTAYADNLISGDSYGVRGAAWHGTTGNYSVYGDNPGTGSNDWSGYFPGRTYVAGTTYIPSDENLKENIAPVENATAQLMQLDPQQYQYLCEAYPHMGLPQGTRYGFIAQQFALQFPNMVTNAHQPAELDSLGQVVHPSVDFMAISTGDLTPLIVAGFKEQQAVIVGLQEALAQMQVQLAACCVNSGDNRMLHAGSNTAGAMETDLRIIPNPVADRTELRYTTANEGRVRLVITDATGRTTLVQDEGERAADSYVYEWDTTLLAPGTYHCTLYVNDERLVEKAVKLNAR